MERILTPETQRFIEEWENDSEYVIAHTSGSTGIPKEIRLLKSDMRKSAHATIKFFEITPESLLYLPLSADYIAGKMQIVRAIEAGCSLISVTPSNHPLSSFNQSSISSIGRPIDLLPIVPSQIPGLLSSDLHHMVRNLIIGGAPIHPATEKSIIESHINAYATYGMTETCSHVALRRLGEKSFHALPGIEFDTDDRDCLVITSPAMSFSTLITNDIVKLSDSHTFRWLGRYDNVINTGGIKIYPEELERIIAPLFPDGTLFYITSRPSALWGEEIVLVTDSPTLPDNLMPRLRSILPKHSVPKDVIQVPKIPFTSSKKIIRNKNLHYE